MVNEFYEIVAVVPCYVVELEHLYVLCLKVHVCSLTTMCVYVYDVYTNIGIVFLYYRMAAICEDREFRMGANVL